jgi:hypothetical protein
MRFAKKIPEKVWFYGKNSGKMTKYGRNMENMDYRQNMEKYGKYGLITRILRLYRC